MKKKKEKKIKKAEKEKLNSKEKQIKIFFIFMMFLIVLILLFYFLWQKTKKFEYAGLEFVKEKKGSLNLYYVRFPIKNALGNVVNHIPFYFREDPRKLERIKINGGKIILMKDVALTSSSESMGCEDSMVAATSLFLFLGKAGVSPFVATINKSIAEEFNKTYVSCDETNQFSIIIFEKGNENVITKFSDCYTLSFANCEIMNVTEKFMLGLYAHSRKMELK